MQHMDAWGSFVVLAYAIFFTACAVGAFSRTYSANLAQRLAMALFAVWSAWRMGLVWRHGWGYPHEPLMASAMALYALGSAYKTIKWHLRHRRTRAGHPCRRKEDMHGLL